MLWAAVCVVALVLLAGCGGSEDADRPSLAEIVPSDAPLYGEFVLRPAGPDGRALRRFAGTVLGTGTAARDDLAELAVDALRLDLDFERDVAPWLGERAGFFLLDLGSSTTGALLVETTDPRRAARGVRRATGVRGAVERIPGGTYWRTSGDGVAGLVHDRVVVAGSAAVIRASARAGAQRSLAGTKRYREAAAQMNGRRPAAYVVSARGDTLEDLLGFLRLPPAERRLLLSAIDPTQALTLRADVTATDAVVEVLGLRAPGPAAPPIEGLPAAAWLAISSGNLGETLTTGLTAGGPAIALRRLTLTPFPQGTLRGLGRGSLHLQGGEGVVAAEGEIEAGVRDPMTVAKGVEQLARRLRASRLFDVELTRYRGELGLVAEPKRYPRAGGGLEVAFQRDEITVFFGGIVSANALGETRAYRRAARVLGGPPTTLLRMRPFARALGATGDLGFAARIDIVAAEEKRLPGGGLLQRFMVGLNPDAPPGSPPEGQEPASEPASASWR
jgi:hypothetical protein